jgi:hypothetical protein
VITCDETWIHVFEPESKQTSEFCLEAAFLAFPYTSDNFQVSGKVMAIIFSDTYGNYSATLLRTELMAAIRRKRPHLHRSGFISHQNTAPSHSSHVVMDTLEKLDVELLPYPPYSPDLAICDFWLFPTLKNVVRYLSQVRN